VLGTGWTEIVPLAGAFVIAVVATPAGARFQSRMPDLVIRRLIGTLVVAIGIRYLWSGLDR
jgi:uncharacterized membrane protein YfcA